MQSLAFLIVYNVFLYIALWTRKIFGMARVFAAVLHTLARTFTYLQSSAGTYVSKIFTARKVKV